MLLCHIDDVSPGAVLGASVMNPAAPGAELLKPGVELDTELIRRLVRRGVTQVWIMHDLTADLDAAVAPRLTAAKTALYNAIKDDFGVMSHRTLTTTDIGAYRTAIMDLVVELMSSAKFAGMTDQLFASTQDFFTHCANVTYLATLIGLELRPYIVRERARLAPDQAQDLAPLGLGAMLHDIGKLQCDSDLTTIHEATRHGIFDPTQESCNEGAEAGGVHPYRNHAVAGYEMLRATRAPASASHIVLNHHQRFDGSGWPSMAEMGKKDGGDEGQAGRSIHIFSRIVAAANVLDNLLSGSNGKRRPPVCALAEFASERFDGWFDPVVRTTVLRRVPPFAIGVSVRLSDGRHAVVTAPNTHQPCRPIVRSLERCDTEGDGDPVVDLARQSNLYITHYAGVDIESSLYELPTVAPVAQAA